MFSQSCSFLYIITDIHHFKPHVHCLKSGWLKKKNKNLLFSLPSPSSILPQRTNFPKQYFLGCPPGQEPMISLLTLYMIGCAGIYLVLKAFHQVDPSTFQIHSYYLFTFPYLCWILKDSVLILTSALWRPTSLLLSIPPLLLFQGSGQMALIPWSIPWPLQLTFLLPQHFWGKFSNLLLKLKGQHDEHLYTLHLDSPINICHLLYLSMIIHFFPFESCTHHDILPLNISAYVPRDPWNSI